jgi:hypothetical protein
MSNQDFHHFTLNIGARLAVPATPANPSWESEGTDEVPIRRYLAGPILL